MQRTILPPTYRGALPAGHALESKDALRCQSHQGRSTRANRPLHVQEFLSGRHSRSGDGAAEQVRQSRCGRARRQSSPAHLKAAVKCIDSAALLLGHQLSKHGGVVGAAPAGERAVEGQQAGWEAPLEVLQRRWLPTSYIRPAMWGTQTQSCMRAANQPRLIESPKVNSTMPYTLM